MKAYYRCRWCQKVWFTHLESNIAMSSHPLGLVQQQKPTAWHTCDDSRKGLSDLVGVKDEE